MKEKGAVRRRVTPPAHANAGLRAAQIGLTRGAVRLQASSPAPANSNQKKHKSVITTQVCSAQVSVIDFGDHSTGWQHEGRCPKKPRTLFKYLANHRSSLKTIRG